MITITMNPIMTTIITMEDTKLASKWWLFIGCALICSGFLLPIGVIILIWYFADFIFNKGGINTGTQYIVNLNVQNNPEDYSDKDDFDTTIDHMSNYFREAMR